MLNFRFRVVAALCLISFHFAHAAPPLCERLLMIKPTRPASVAFDRDAILKLFDKSIRTKSLYALGIDELLNFIASCVHSEQPNSKQAHDLLREAFERVTGSPEAAQILIAEGKSKDPDWYSNSPLMLAIPKVQEILRAFHCSYPDLIDPDAYLPDIAFISAAYAAIPNYSIDRSGATGFKPDTSKITNQSRRMALLFAYVRFHHKPWFFQLMFNLWTDLVAKHVETDKWIDVNTGGLSDPAEFFIEFLTVRNGLAFEAAKAFANFYGEVKIALGHPHAQTWINAFQNDPLIDSFVRTLIAIDDDYEENVLARGSSPFTYARRDYKLQSLRAAVQLPETSKAEFQATLNELTRLAPPNVSRIVMENVKAYVYGEDIRRAWKSVHERFDALRTHFIERDALIDDIELAFLAGGSILIPGGSGTGKSAIAHALGASFVTDDQKPSYFALAMTQDTTLSETKGGLIVKESLNGRQVRNVKYGVGGAKLVFLDEFFDARLKFLRSFLTAFNEKVEFQGLDQPKLLTEVFIAATNKYINNVYEDAGNNDPQALYNRFMIVHLAPDHFEELDSLFRLSDLEKFKVDRPATYAELG